MTSLIKKIGGAVSFTSVRPDPGRDWLLLIGASIAVLVLSVGWNVWFFGHVVSEGVQGVSGEESALAGYESSAVQEIFDTRAEAAKEYREMHVFVDPSVQGE